MLLCESVQTNLLDQELLFCQVKFSNHKSQFPLNLELETRNASASDENTQCDLENSQEMRRPLGKEISTKKKDEIGSEAGRKKIEWEILAHAE